MSKRAAFLQAALSGDSSECVLWPFAVRASSGYGAHSIPLGKRDVKRSVDAHAYVCEMANGPRPSASHQAAHSCGNKLCCNPKHLRWATPRENMADAIAHGSLKGGGRYRQRLTSADVETIRSSARSLISLGREFGLDPAYIGKVRRGECHVG